MIGSHQNLNSLRDLTTPLSGMICHAWASTCYRQVNLPTKLQVSISTRYEDMKGDTKCRKLGGLG